MREYDTGATRNNAEDKPNYEGFLSPLVIKEFGRYMHRHRHQADGVVRDGDNWQKGMPKDDYIDSLLRHVMDVWLHHRGYPQQAEEDLKEALCAILFNAQGYLFTTLLEEMEPSIEDWTFTMPINTTEKLYDPDESIVSLTEPSTWTCAICDTEGIAAASMCPVCLEGLNL